MTANKIAGGAFGQDEPIVEKNRFIGRQPERRALARMLGSRAIDFHPARWFPAAHLER